MKQQIDTEWKEQVLKKLEKVDELVVQIQRVTDALERIAGIRSKTPENDLISWPESKEKEPETVERVDKGKSRKIVEIEHNNKQSKMVIEDGEDRIEGVEKVIGTPVLSV